MKLVLVPAEPTDEMVAAGQVMLPDDMPLADAVYAMMLAAAPQDVDAKRAAAAEAKLAEIAKEWERVEATEIFASAASFDVLRRAIEGLKS